MKEPIDNANGDPSAVAEVVVTVTVGVRLIRLVAMLVTGLSTPLGPLPVAVRALNTSVVALPSDQVPPVSVASSTAATGGRILFVPGSC